MYNYQSVRGAFNFGGARTVFTGTMTGITSGYYGVDITRVPDGVNGHVPAGTPIFVDDENRVADIHYAFEVVKGSTTTKTRVAKSIEGSRAWVGMNIMVVPATIDTTGTAFAITAVDRSNDEYDILTHADLSEAIAAGTILVEADKAGAGAVIKVKPNGFLPYDYRKAPNASEMRVDAIFAHTDGVLLTRRVPPIAPIIREYLGDPNGGNTYFRYSKSRE